METFPLFACSALPKTKHAAQVGEHLPTPSGKTREFVQIPGYLEAAFLKEDNRGSSEQQLSVLRRLGWRPRESAIPAQHILTALPTAVTLSRACYKTSTEIILFSCRNARIEMQEESSKEPQALWRRSQLCSLSRDHHTQEIRPETTPALECRPRNCFEKTQNVPAAC